MALGNETLPLGGDENDWQMRNSSTPFIDLANTDQAAQNAADPTGPEALSLLSGGQQAPDNGAAQLASIPDAPNVATPSPQNTATMPMEGAPQAPQGPQAPTGPQVATPRAPQGAAPPEAALAPLGPPPTMPPLTGDPTKDVQSNIQWHRELTNYQALAQQHGQALEVKKSEVEKTKADRELQMEQHAATIREAADAKYAGERQSRQADIDKTVSERAAAYGDLSKGNGFLDQSTGDKVLGAIMFAFGDYQAMMQNVAAAQLGQVGHAENQGLKQINAIMAQRYQTKKDKLAAASDAVLEARYGAKDAEENHRSAMNDLDADAAANLRLAAKEAASQGAQLGTEQAQQTGLAMHAALLKEAADYEAKIHEREEELGVKRQTAAASQAATAAHFDQGERQIQATQEHNRGTLALGWAGEKDRHQDRQDAMAAKKTADAEKASTKEASDAEKKKTALDARTLRDPDTGEDIEVMPNARGVQKASDQLVASRAYSQGLRAYADDIEKNDRVAPSFPLFGNVTDASKQRDELHSNVVARGRKALDLGVSNANMQLEHGAIGGAGKGLGSMSDPKVLRRIADEQDAIANQRLRSSGKVVNGSVPPVAPTGGAPSGGRASTSGPPQSVIDEAYRALEPGSGASKEQKQKATAALVAAGHL